MWPTASRPVDRHTLIQAARQLRQGLNRQLTRARFQLLHWEHLPRHPRVQLTCAGRTDGGGAQWLSTVSVLAFAGAYRIPFAHTPFQVIEHGSGDSGAWLEAWNSLFNLQACGIPQAPSCAHQLSCHNLLQAHRSLARHPGEPGVWALRHAHQFSNLYPTRLASLRSLLRQAYRPRSQLAPPPQPLDRTLVVHVRRGDVQASGPHQHRFTSATTIAARCRRIQIRYPHLRQVLLLSASPDADLLCLCDQGFALDASHDVFSHFHWMSQAAGLVMARSALSYLAAMLNPHLVFYDRFEHPPLPGWIRLPRGRSQ
ncbi:MAG: hypothetical protein VKM34_03300 [Cyanobacteriota bacterium]|nr:hypothetical protein [Cyanobacteriota bacterium]